MLLSSVHIKGYRNFKDCMVNLNKKALVIGPNDIGKSNFIQAIRLLLDRTLSEANLEPLEEDFYAFEETTKIEITLQFTEANEECVRAKMREKISEEGEFYLRYVGLKEASGPRRFVLSAGHSLNDLQELDGRFYLRAFYLNYIDSNRDLLSFIRREKRHLLQQAKETRRPEEQAQDEKYLGQIQNSLSDVNRSVGSLSYVSKATAGLNKELSDLSIRNESVSVQFDSGASRPEGFVENLRLSSRYGEHTVALGGDGRNNQIFLALWAARNQNPTDGEPLEVVINCIEEPEAHLHPHQQRKLADYLVSKISGQVIITTHSPQIACEFKTNSIVNFFDSRPGTCAAHDGCSSEVENALLDFGHRLNILPAEGFFASVVLLVEGVSEVIFFKALASEIGIDLDRLNISVLSVDGVGFSTYKQVFHSLSIPTVIRTDLDIMKVPKAERFRVAGLQRACDIYRKFCVQDAAFQAVLNKSEHLLADLSAKIPDESHRKLFDEYKAHLLKYDIFLANKDLEADLIQSPIQGDLKKFFNESSLENLEKEMKSAKGQNMFGFLLQEHKALSKLKGHEITKPLLACERIAKSVQ